jgi:predicted phage terminase large subunit-like protein
VTAAVPLSAANRRAWSHAKSAEHRAVKADGPSLYRPDGKPIGSKAYCELVTPEWNWEWKHLQVMDGVIDRIVSGELRFVILSVPPRHGKTEKMTVRQAAYRLELDPSLPIILAAYNSKTARKFSRKIRRLARGRIELSKERQAAEDWETEAGGGVRAAGVGEGIAGLPGKLILVDDPIKDAAEADSQAFRDRVWEWYTEDVYTRLEPGGAIVITMTRRHEDDLVGRILASEDGPSWTVIRLPAIAEDTGDPIGRAPGEALCPDRYDETALARIKRVVGPRTWSSLYQQRPAPAEGYIFKSEWFRYYTTRDHPIIENGFAVPTLPPVMQGWLQSWDMSFKEKSDSDFVDGQVWSRLGADCYLRDEDHARRDFVGSLGAVKRLSAKWPDAHLKLIEDKANGPAIISAARDQLPGLVAVQPEGDKVSRAYAVTPICESGNVWLPHPAIAPWVTRLVLSLTQFPYGQHDDDVDAFTQALRRLMQQIDTGQTTTGNGQQVMSEAARVANMRR